MSLNKVVLAGNLTREPELKSLPSGSSILSFGIAVTERRRNNQTGEWEERSNYFDCTMFGTRAESLSRYMHKGDKIALEGRLQWRQWQDSQTGQNRSKVDIIVNEVEFMSGRRQEQQPQPVAQPQPVKVGGQPLAMEPVPAQPMQVQQELRTLQADPYALANEDIPF